jgi:hypothetical protein
MAFEKEIVVAILERKRGRADASLGFPIKEIKIKQCI